MKNAIYVVLILFVLNGCSSAAKHRMEVQDNSADRVTVGKVQREIRVGMSSAQVIEILGSPNIVSTDEQRREVWVYDKIATDTAYSTSEGGISVLVLGAGSHRAGALGAGVSGTSGAQSTSQRTLTIIIKYDRDGLVRDFAYHTSRF